MNYFIDPLKKYATFGGRASRKEYWMFTLWVIIISMVLSFVLGFIGNDTISNLVLIGFLLVILVPAIALAVRRLHDIDKSGWWYLINFVPFIGVIIFLVFMVLPSNPGENTYGPNPYGEGVAPQVV